MHGGYVHQDSTSRGFKIESTIAHVQVSILKTTVSSGKLQAFAGKISYGNVRRLYYLMLYIPRNIESE